MARFKIVQKCHHPNCGAPELICCPVTRTDGDTQVEVLGESPRSVSSLAVDDVVKFVDFVGFLRVVSIEPESEE